MVSDLGIRILVLMVKMIGIIVVEKRSRFRETREAVGQSDLGIGFCVTQNENAEHTHTIGD